MYAGMMPHEGGFNDFFYWNKDSSQFVTDHAKSTDYPSFIEKDYVIRILSDNLLEFDFGGNGDNAKFVKTDFNKAINGLLFAGTYVDEAGKAVEFTDAGTTNLDGYETYDFTFDFFMVDFDLITLYRGSDSQIYHYKVKDNTIELYSVISVETEEELGYKKSELYKTLTKK